MEMFAIAVSKPAAFVFFNALQISASGFLRLERSFRFNWCEVYFHGALMWHRKNAGPGSPVPVARGDFALKRKRGVD
jgi:hypothetical protein